VHIAMGKDTLFGEPRPAKASVVLKLKGQRTLAASTINGISNLVASSVDGLRPESVVILDSFGRPLARPEGDNNDPLGGAQLERQQRIERDMSTRVIALLEPTIAYYMHRNGRPAFERNSQLQIFDTLSTPAYVVTGVYVRRSRRMQKQLAGLADKLTPIATAPMRPYDVRLLDDLEPAAARRYRAHPDSTFDLRLYRYNPGAGR